MKYFTCGKSFWTDYEMPLFFNDNELFQKDFNNEFYYKIIFLKQGKGIFNFSGKKIIGIAPMVICLDENEKPELIDGENLISNSIYFQPEVINSIFTKSYVNNNNNKGYNVSTNQDFSIILPFINHEKSKINCINLGAVTAKRLNHLFERLRSELKDQRSNESWPCSSRSYFLEILFLIERINKQSLPVEDNAIIEEQDINFIDIDKLLQYINTNYMKNISIKELAKMFCTNRTSLYDSFNKRVGMPIISYLIKIRIEVACLILRNTELPVSEVVERTGFNDKTHFGRMFKKYMNISPSEYRKKHCWMLNNN